MIHNPYFDALPGIALLAILSVFALAGAMPIIVSGRRWLPQPQPVRGRIVRRLEALIVMALALPVLLLLLYERPAMHTFLQLLSGSSEHLPFMFAEVVPLSGRFALACFLGLAVAITIITGACSWKLSTTLASVVLAIALVFGSRGFTQWLNELRLFRTVANRVWDDPRNVNKEWEAGIERLLDQARLEGYQPPPEWYDAFLSYEAWGWDRLHAASKLEPKLLRLADACANHVYHIDQVHTSAQAWTTLMQIRDEAVANRNYASNSYQGRAVDLLVPKLDPNQLTFALVKILDNGSFPLSRHRLSPSGTDDWLWQRRPRGSSAHPPEVLAIQPLFQAAWQLDRTSNKHRPDQSNIVEDRVTPALLRHILRDPLFIPRYVEVLGGPAYEQFLIRHDWKTGPDEFVEVNQNQPSVRWLVEIFSHLDSDAKSHFDSARTVGVGNAKVNRWFYQLMYQDSPGGRQFCRDHRERLLQIAVRSFEPVPRKKAGTETERLAQMVRTAILSNARAPRRHATPAHLDFLFLDQAFTTDGKSLAMEFWPYFDRKLATTPEIRSASILRARWNYLARMWPESTVEMFVAAYPDRSPLYEYPGSNRRTAQYYLPDNIPADVRFAILVGVRDRLRQKLRSLPDPQQALDNPYNAVNDIDPLGWSMQQLPCPASATQFMQSYEADESSEKLNELRKRMANDIVHNDLFELLARHDNPELRSVALLAIGNHPIARRVALLNELLDDPAPAIRTEAAKLHQELEALKREPPRPRAGYSFPNWSVNFVP